MLCDEAGKVAVCQTCGQVLHSPYWSASKSKTLHERGTGHKVKVVHAGTLVKA